MGTDQAAALATEFSQVARSLFAAGSVRDTLAEVAALAVATIEGCDFAGIFFVQGDVVSSPAHTDPRAPDVDALQHRSGEGPCLDAMTHRLPFYADDLAEDSRWPSFGPEALRRGVRSILALPLSGGALSEGALSEGAQPGGAQPGGGDGALGLYATYSRAFGVVDRARGLLLASLAGLAISSARGREYEARLADNFHSALRSRELIGQAQGILIERERISADQAFEILRRASQHLNKKLRDVAMDLVETGEGPEMGPVPC